MEPTYSIPSQSRDSWSSQRPLIRLYSLYEDSPQLNVHYLVKTIKTIPPETRKARERRNAIVKVRDKMQLTVISSEHIEGH